MTDRESELWDRACQKQDRINELEDRLRTLEAARYAVTECEHELLEIATARTEAH